jgi:hypothetical protein
VLSGAPLFFKSSVSNFGFRRPTRRWKKSRNQWGWCFSHLNIERHGEKWIKFKYVESVNHEVLQHLCLHVSSDCDSARRHPSSHLPNFRCHHYRGYVLLMKLLFVFVFFFFFFTMCCEGWVKGSRIFVSLVANFSCGFTALNACPSNKRWRRTQFHA